MIKLRKFLKPFIAMIAAAFVLLFAQAICDLKLPDYMSDIVNVGIQQSGIEHPAPQAISENGMQLLQIFMDDEEVALVKENYELVEQNDEAYLSEYAALADQSLYILKSPVSDELDDSFAIATSTFVNVIKSLSQDTANAASGKDFSADNIDFTEIYQMIPMLSMLDDATIEQARAQALLNGESTMGQTGIAFTKLFYQEIGLDTMGMQTAYIIKIGLLMLGITLLGAAATISVGFLASKVGAGLGRNLRKAIFDKVASFSNAEFDRFSTSSLITRTTNDITQVQMLVVMGMRTIFYAPIMGFGGLLMIMNKNTSMVWILGLALVLLFILILAIMMLAMPKFTIMQKLIDRLNLVTRENLSGLLVVRAFGAQQFEEERFDVANKNLMNNSLFVNRVMTFMMPCMNVIMNLTTLLIVWVGANQIAQANMQVGDMMAFMQYAMQIIMSFLMISMVFILIPRASVSAKRIVEVLECEPSILDPEKTEAFDMSKLGEVEFSHVSFAYEEAEEEVIKDISFVAKPGETTAIIGSTGSGKSTLIQLIPRFYDVSKGVVKVNGVDVRHVNQHDLHKQIGYVPQKGVLLSGTIASNIAYGNDQASDEEIIQAARIAQACDFIEKKEDGYDSLIAEGGVNVSGGQKQRLSIARALATHAPIYIFDDSFSALDFKTDRILRQSLKEEIKDATCIIVAQRVSTIMNAEQILVLDEGKLVGKGTHQELLKNCPTYYEIAASQLSKEELSHE